jgi:hypothetical protein
MAMCSSLSVSEHFPPLLKDVTMIEAEAKKMKSSIEGSFLLRLTSESTS